MLVFLHILKDADKILEGVNILRSFFGRWLYCEPIQFIQNLLIAPTQSSLRRSKIPTLSFYEADFVLTYFPSSLHTSYSDHGVSLSI